MSAMRDIPGHSWLREADWLALCDRLQVVTLRMAALEVALEGGPLASSALPAASLTS